MPMTGACWVLALVCLGPCLDQQGIVKLAPNLPWRDVAFQSELSQELSASVGVTGLRIQVQNAVTMTSRHSASMNSAKHLCPIP